MSHQPKIEPDHLVAEAVLARSLLHGENATLPFGVLDVDLEQVFIPFPYVSFKILAEPESFLEIDIDEGSRRSVWFCLKIGETFIPGNRKQTNVVHSPFLERFTEHAGGCVYDYETKRTLMNAAELLTAIRQSLKAL